MMKAAKAILLAHKKDEDGLTETEAQDVLYWGSTGPWDDSTISSYEDGYEIPKPTYLGAKAREQRANTAEKRIKKHFATQH